MLGRESVRSTGAVEHPAAELWSRRRGYARLFDQAGLRRYTSSFAEIARQFGCSCRAVRYTLDVPRHKLQPERSAYHRGRYG